MRLTPDRALAKKTETMPRMLHAMARSSLVLTGLVLLAVGIANVVAGTSKVGQYQEIAVATASRVQHRSPTLFPAASETEERHALAAAKVAFYQLLTSAGWTLGALGGALVAIGALRVWTRTPRALLNSRAAN
jgi:hypothetical protein